jgi:hypothetical protein
VIDLVASLELMLDWLAHSWREPNGLPSRSNSPGLITSRFRRRGSGLSSEAQFMRFAPTGFGIHVTRARIAGKWRKPVTELSPIIVAAAGALSDASPGLIVVSTSAMGVEAPDALGINGLSSSVHTRTTT